MDRLHRLTAWNNSRTGVGLKTRIIAEMLPVVRRDAAVLTCSSHQVEQNFAASPFPNHTRVS